MKVAELIRLLERMDEGADVMVAYQPSWPLQEKLSDVVEYREGEDDEDDRYDDEGEPVVYLVAGGQSAARGPYAPRGVFER